MSMRQSKFKNRSERSNGTWFCEDKIDGLQCGSLHTFYGRTVLEAQVRLTELGRVTTWKFGSLQDLAYRSVTCCCLHPCFKPCRLFILITLRFQLDYCDCSCRLSGDPICHWNYLITWYKEEMSIWKSLLGSVMMVKESIVSCEILFEYNRK